MIISFIAMYILAVNCFRALACAMVKVFIAAISRYIRAKHVLFKSVATCHVWYPKFKLVKIKNWTTKNSSSCLHSPHFRCSIPPCGHWVLCWKVCITEIFHNHRKFFWIMLAKQFLFELSCHRGPLFGITFLEINSNLKWSLSSYLLKAQRSTLPKEAGSNNNHEQQPRIH